MLHVHRAERSEVLAEALADVLAEVPADPFVPEIVAVPTRGIERWLAQRLSHRLGAPAGRDGVCANVSFPSPAELVARARGAADDDPWRPERLVWSVLEVIDACRHEPWCGPLAAYLGGDDGDGTRYGRRFSAARHLAELFTRYGEHRPELVRTWEAGDAGDEGGVPTDLRWQPRLWRRLRERVGEPSPAETLEEACRALEGTGGPDLPERLSLFGPTRLSVAQSRVLQALATRREVHLWLPHPSPALWDRVAALPPDTDRRADDRTADGVGHPLLSSLGRDVRELQVRLRPLGAVDHHHDAGEAAPDRPTLLGRLQRDLRDDRTPRPESLDPDDDSVRVHACHGPDRQVEVLREVVLGLLADDPTLEPRDIVVLCPDIETFAPLITASFGGPTEDDEAAHPAHRLRVRLADRALTQVNPVLATVATLLDLADARVTASEVLDLAESPPVRRRFRLGDDDLERMRELAHGSGVRWGLDAAHRRPFKLDRFGDNTWERGLDRLLVGVALSGDEHQWLDTALPVDDIDSETVGLVGTLAELVDRLTDVLDDLTGRHPLAHWIDTLRRGLDILTAAPPDEAWQAGHARSVLGRVVADAGEATGELTLPDVRAVLAGELRGHPTRANFRTGALTVATLTPLRSVPHRVVCLLGLDDQVFPRRTRDDGDDVLARDPRVGERDPAAQDRQLLLDAIGAATERLVVVHSGADERTNQTRPPAVPVGELLDTLDAAVADPAGRRARDLLTVRHPLQPFAPANFAARGPEAAPAVHSFDPVHLDGARALDGERAPAAPFVSDPLPARADDVLALDDLVRFVEHPVRAFLRQRLGLTARQDEDDPAEAVPITLDGLERWGVGDRLLRDRLAGHGPAECGAAELRRGTLPPGSLGRRVLQQVGAQVDPLVTGSAPYRTQPARDVDVTCEVEGTTLSGSVPDVRGDVLLTVTYSSLGAKQKLRAWVRLLAVTVAHPDRSWEALIVAKGKDDAARYRLGPLDPTTAGATLADLVALHREGMRRPLPLITDTSREYAETRAAKKAWVALERARRTWSRRHGERTDPAYVQVWGPARTLDDVLLGTGTEFGDLALRLWEPLLTSAGGGS